MRYVKTKGSSARPLNASPANEESRVRLVSTGAENSFSAFHSKYGLKFPEPFVPGRTAASPARQPDATHDSGSVVGFIESIAGRIDDLLAAAVKIKNPAA